MAQQIRWWMVVGAVAVLATTASVSAGQDAQTVLMRARAALGGDTQVAAIKTLSVTGRTVRQRADNTAAEHPFEMAFEAPSRFVRRSVVMAMGPTSIYRHSGFDGDTAIEWIDSPPSLAGGGNVVIRMQWQSADGESTEPDPAQIAARQARTLEQNRQEFARLSLGLFAAAPASYPLDFRHAGVAESPDGRANIIAVTGPNGFTANLFVDEGTHLPLMVSWQAPEPVEVVSEGGPREGSRVVRRLEGSPGPAPGATVTDGTATAERPLVEHRLVFADYKTFDAGVKLPTRLQRVIAGRTVEETTFERVRVNQRLDGRAFATGN